MTIMYASAIYACQVETQEVNGKSRGNFNGNVAVHEVAPAAFPDSPACWRNACTHAPQVEDFE
jgi:hypothetical protein